MDRDLVVRYVYQYLEENGFRVAAMALNDAVEEDLTDAVTALSSGMLLSTLDQYVDFKSQKPQKEEEENTEDLAVKGDGRFCSELCTALTDLHAGNIISSVLTKDALLVTGSADRTIKVTQVNGLPEFALVPEAGKALTHHTGPVLALAVHPSLPHIVLSADMVGRISLFNAKTGAVLQDWTVHKKYVVRVKWSPCGKYFASAGYDKTCVLFGLDGSSDLSASSDAVPTFKEINTFHFRGCVESIVFTDKELAIGSREDHLIHLVNLNSLERREINMNALGDTHISFTPMDLSVSPNGRYLLVSTDKDRLILYSLATGNVIRTFYGASNDGYSNPKHCWHPTGLYIYSTSQNYTIVVWEVATMKVVAELKGHTNTVRDLYFSAENSTLISAGFDKTVHVWKMQDQ